MAQRRFVFVNLSHYTLDIVPLLDFLQERLARETSLPEFSKLPLRFAEIAKVILDVSVEYFIHLNLVMNLTSLKRLG